MPEVKLTVRDSEKRETTITKEIEPDKFAAFVERMIKTSMNSTLKR